MKNAIKQNHEDLNSNREACCVKTSTLSSKPLIYGISASFVMIGFYLGLITLTI
jgi:hypothetical protein